MSFIATLFGPSALHEGSTGWIEEVTGGVKTAAGRRITPKGALSLAAYYACLRVISEDIAKMPLRVYRRMSPRGREPLPNHPVDPLVHRTPNEEQTAIAFREMVTHWAMGWGKGCAKIERGPGGQPISLMAIHPDRIRLQRTKEAKRIYQVRIDNQANGKDQRYMTVQPRDMLHITGFGGYALSVLAGESIALGMEAERFGGSFFGNGAVPGSVLEHPGKISSDAKKHLTESIQKEHGGASQRHKVLLVEEGITWKQMTIPPEQAQFIATQQFSVETICRWFRVAPHKVQHLLRSTFNNIEHQGIEHVGDTLLPWAERWEQEGDGKLFGPAETDLFIKHNFTALLRGDMVKRSQYYRNLWQMAALSINDILELEDRNPIGPEGDRRFVPVNYQTLDRAISNPTAKTPAQPAGGAEERSALRASFLPLLEEAISRVLTKESKALARAGKRHAGNAEAFGRWSGEFYEEQEAYFEEAVGPIVEGLAALAGVALNGQVQTAATAYVDDSKEAVNGEVTEARMTEIGEWTDGRAEEMATAIIDEVIQDG